MSSKPRSIPAPTHPPLPPTHTCTHIHTHTHIKTCTQMHTNTHTHIYTHIHTHVHVHTHTHTQVYLGRYKQTGQHYAIKVLTKKSIVRRNEVKHIMAERNVLLKNVQHPFLVGLHYSFQTGNKLYFVLDYVNGGELFFHLQRERCFDEPRAR